MADTLLSTRSRSRPRSRYSAREPHHARVGIWISTTSPATPHAPPAATTHESCVAAAGGSSSAAPLRGEKNPARERVDARARDVRNGRGEGGGSSRAAAAERFARAAAAPPPGGGSVDSASCGPQPEDILHAQRAPSLPAHRRGRPNPERRKFLIEAIAAAPSRAAAERQRRRAESAAHWRCKFSTPRCK